MSNESADVVVLKPGEWICEQCERKLPSDEQCSGALCHDCTGCSDPLGTDLPFDAEALPPGNEETEESR